MSGLSAGRYWARTNWFLLLLPFLLLTELAFARSNPWSEPELAEATVLFDLCIFVPALYALCYRKKLALKPLLLRLIGLSCLGLFIASRLVPPEAQRLLPHLSWARTAGWIVLGLVELKVFVEIMKLVFSGRTTADRIATEGGVPPWFAKLMLLEVRFWKAVWKFIRGR